jgi:hypothetical protein
MGVEIAMLVLRRISSSAVAALSMVVDLAFRKPSARLSPEAHRLLGKIAMHTRCSVSELSLSLSLPRDDILLLLIELEHCGAVQLGGKPGAGRIAVITNAGREQLDRAKSALEH